MLARASKSLTPAGFLLLVSMVAALWLLAPAVASAQGIQGSETGFTGQFRVPPQNQIFNQDQQDVCVKFNEIERTSTRSCVYRCGSGQVFERTLPRTRFCQVSLNLTLREINRAVTGTEAAQCRLRRLRLTRTDKICVYNCDGQTVTQAIPTSRNCDRNFSR